MNQRYEVLIASVPDREEVVAEIFIDDVLWGELTDEGRPMNFEVYPHPSGEPWTVDVDDLLRAIQSAKDRLLAMGPKRS